MKIVIVRHGDPNYEIDSLTEKGWKEAELLADRLCKMDIDAFYVSPLGRAKDTASVTLKRLKKEATTLDWLQEFGVAQVKRPDLNGGRGIAWDWLPADWTVEEKYYDKDLWMKTDVMQDSIVEDEYQKVCKGLDELLAKHGYEREGNVYRVVRPNRDCIALVCHFGLECVLLSHLLGISPMPLWHGFAAPTTSVTTIYSEERREGIASFRVTSFGDVSHLYVKDEPLSFSARFCETYDSDERHD